MFDSLIISSIKLKSPNLRSKALEVFGLIRSGENLTWAKINDKKQIVSKKVVFIRTDDGKGPRETKELTTLSRGGFTVVLLAWDRTNSLSPFERDEEGVVIKRLKLPAPQNSILLLLFLPIFILWSLICLVVISPDVLHAIDLDSAIPAYLYKQIARKTSFIFDVFDRYAWRTPALCNNRFLSNIINLIEELLASRADLTITVSGSLLTTFCRFKLKRSMILYNAPRKEDIEKARTRSIRRKNGELRIYISHLTNETALLAKSVKGLNDVRIVITGKVLLNMSVAERILSSSLIEYHGFLPYLDALSIENTADVFALLYAPSTEISKYRLSGNRFFEAFLMNKLVFTNIWDSYAYEKICPYVRVDYDEDSIRQAVQDLIKIKKTGKNLMKSLQRASGAKNMPCWEAMEQRLLTVYRELTS